MLFNLIDNAFNATLQADKKKVTLKIRQVKRVVYINISNTKLNGLVHFNKTSKKDKNNHGIGIKIIEDIVKDYQGKMEYIDKESILDIFV